MRSRRNKLWVAAAIVLVFVVTVVALYLRTRVAPDVVRLLPECDAVLYVNLEPLRLLTTLGKTPPPNREPEYEDFVQQTGFEFERDLEKAAFAIHYAAAGQNKSTETRYSEILQGRFEGSRVSAYLRQKSGKVEQYRGFDVYVIPLEGRTLRVALLGVDTAAVSNNNDPQVLHGMIDRYKQAALPFPGPALVSNYYRKVPLGSMIWSIAHVPSSKSLPGRGELLLPGEWSEFLPQDSVVVASARPLKAVHLRAQVITSSDTEASNFTARLNTFLALFKSLNISMEDGGSDPDVKAAFNSLEVHQEKSEAVLTATVPFGFFRKILSEPPVELGPSTEKPQGQQSPAAKP